jgi:hypothetical protein
MLSVAGWRGRFLSLSHWRGRFDPYLTGVAIGEEEGEEERESKGRCRPQQDFFYLTAGSAQPCVPGGVRVQYMTYVSVTCFGANYMYMYDVPR